MIARERYIRTMRFEPVDRVPLIEWPIRGATMRRWIAEGYPEGIQRSEEQARLLSRRSSLHMPYKLG